MDMVMRKNNNPERFKNRAEALEWLQIRGHISRGKFYSDCNAGHIVVHPDKSMSKFQVAEYAEKVFRFARQSAPTKLSAEVAPEVNGQTMGKPE